VSVARTTTIPACTAFVDAANGSSADGSSAHPYKTIRAAVNAAANGAVLCVAEGTYAEQISPGTKYFTLAGGFQTGHDFKIRDSSLYVSKAQGSGSGSFVRITDPGPTAGQLTAVDGFEITGYAQAILRDIYYAQNFDLTNNYIHDNTCASAGDNGAAFSLVNVSGTISGNVLSKNKCSRGGGGSTDDTINASTIVITGNLVDANVGNEAGISHGGGLYLFAKTLTVSGNIFTGNSATGWGGGLYIGAYTGGGKTTNATLAWNFYRDNRAGIYGGGLFCDDSAHCASDHEIFDKNCGGNVYLDCGPDGSDPTIASFDHLTNSRALGVGCTGSGPGVQITKNNTANDSYSFTNSIFWGNAPGVDFDASCGSGCANVKVTVTYSDVQTSYSNGGVQIAFGAGNQTSVDPLFVAPDARDFHLRSTHGHWTPTAYTMDTTDSPALHNGDPTGAANNNPPRAGTRTEMGAYGNSAEASYIQ
jgi:hypothetical protein